MIASDTPRQQRFASAFNAEWILAGGGEPVMFRFDPSPDVLRLLKRELGKASFDLALLAVDAADAARAKPYMGSIPSYTSSEVNERQSPDVLRDLDNVRFVEIPWLVDADAAAFRGPETPRLSESHRSSGSTRSGWTRSGSRRRLPTGSPRGSSSTAPPVISRSNRRASSSARERLMQFRGGRVVPAGAR